MRERSREEADVVRADESMLGNFVLDPGYTELLTKSIPAPRPPLGEAETFSRPLAPPPNPWCSSKSFLPTLARKVESFDDGPDPAGDGETLRYSCRLKDEPLGVDEAAAPAGFDSDVIGTEAERSMGRARVGEVGAGSK